MADLVAAELFREHAERLGIGRQVELLPSGGDPKDPYAFMESAALLEI